LSSKIVFGVSIALTLIVGVQSAMVNRILVGAHYGLKDWIIQRATAIIMAVYTVIFLVVIGAVGPDSLRSWRGVFANGFMKFRHLPFLRQRFLPRLDRHSGYLDGLHQAGWSAPAADDCDGDGAGRLRRLGVQILWRM
jgi:hypothetical protein